MAKPSIAPDVSVVVPLFNESATVRALVERVHATLTGAGRTYELLLIDDGSTDDTPALLRTLAGAQPAVRVITFTRNFGQAAALACGIFSSRGAIVVTMDGDLQNPPEEIPVLLTAMRDGVEVVSARRAVRHEPFWRWLGSRFVHRIARALVPVAIEDFGGQFKAYRREVVDATRTAWAAGKPFFPLALWLGFRVAEVSVRHEPRAVGASRYRLMSLVRVNVDLITSFTTAPLALLAVVGLGAGAAGVLGITWCLLAARTHGFAAALSLTLFGVGGVFSAAAGLGLYLSRLYRTVSGGPGWVVRSTPVTEREEGGA